MDIPYVEFDHTAQDLFIPTLLLLASLIRIVRPEHFKSIKLSHSQQPKHLQLFPQHDIIILQIIMSQNIGENEIRTESRSFKTKQFLEGASNIYSAKRGKQTKNRTIRKLKTARSKTTTAFKNVL